MTVDFVGRHALGSLTCIRNETVLLNPVAIKLALERGIRNAGATALSWHEHRFEPNGFTLVGILAESHVSVHTYPEHQALFFDVFTCGLTCDPLKVFEELKSCVGDCEHMLEVFERSSRPSHQIHFHAAMSDARI